MSGSDLFNVFNRPLEPCGEAGHTRGSWDSEMKCSELGGGVHQVCTRMDANARSFSALTGQSGWSAGREGQNHCLCLGAYALHAAKAGPELDLKCEAIPSIALTPRYVRQWSTWNGLELPRQIEDGVSRMVEACRAQAPDDASREHLEGLACGMAKAFPGMALPGGVRCAEREIPAVSALEVGALSREYDNIFGPGGKFPFAQRNRNVGGHLWAAHILDHAPELTEEELVLLFSEYCPVSGSPVSPGRPAYPFTHDAEQGTVRIADSGGTGVHHCCRPCICDLQDGTRAAPYPVELKDGRSATLTALTLKRTPCDGKPDGSLGKRGAPALHCTGGRLTGARHAAVGGVELPIVGIVRDGLPGTAAHAQGSAAYCAQRRKTGYRGGMGMMFREVAVVEEDEEGV